MEQREHRMPIGSRGWTHGGIRVAAVLIFLAPGLASCVFAPPAVVPMPTTSAETQSAPARNLIVMLPGRGDRMSRFFDTGFVSTLRTPEFDVIVADAHWGYYRNRTMTSRLHEDVILPAQAKGYESIWILGISMGGFGALLYAEEFPGNVHGLILMAPYLGERRATDAVAAAGGLRNWSGEAAGARDYEVSVWNWLKAAVDDPGTELVLAYGMDDRLRFSYPSLAESLPPARVITSPGGHAWDTWTPLWQRIQQTDLFD